MLCLHIKVRHFQNDSIPKDIGNRKALYHHIIDVHHEDYYRTEHDIKVEINWMWIFWTVNVCLCTI